MKKQGNAKILRKINRKTILRSMRDHAPITRTELVTQTNLSPATITAITKKLIHEDLIVELGKDESNGGRKPVILGLNGGKYYFISIDFAVDSISVALVNLRFEVIVREYRQLTEPMNEELFLGFVTQAVDSMQKTLHEKDVVLALAIGVTGVVNNDKDTIVYSAALNIRNLNVREKLSKVLDFDIYALNDANVSALAEKRHLCNTSNYLYLLIGPSIGAGIVINGEIYGGDSGWAGEIGHTIVKRGGPVCFCGKKGCLISVLASVIPIDNSQKLLATFDMEGNPDFYENDRYKKFCEYLGLVISNYVETHDPELVVIGGAMSMVAPEKMYRDLEMLVHDHLLLGNQDIKILPSTVKQDSVILGGAYFCFEKTLL